ncbi:PREDICTED: vitamin K epoxide reductase complex subunit 1-like protein 1 [Amphimedon queenslandica]|uniref:vitamin-K-epoxide reductase (warfarin-sensitive) n=1 Tax=Amphimedon queenslandica TaxID=400682 RepID=A0A1X7TYV3_AMPQE|nr:PREDICTED: vitamin K epoxide reductase complex subunit 1-like protein 1 [Amphimedon queenslandica]|eukprot:XP_003389455.1 PREDICTED: vitamin K epoxide reductase complex subunit 1-like protein 1 [Amphimedon queenslandica]
MAALSVYSFLSGLGFLVSVYSVVIEHAKLEDDSYSPLCDINERISCTAVLTSEYSYGFGIVELILNKDHFLNQPNSYYGVLFYPLQFIIGLYILESKGLLSLSALLNTGVSAVSLYLMYLLFFVINKVCLVCLVINSINFFLLIYSIAALLRKKEKNKKE